MCKTQQGGQGGQGCRTGLQDKAARCQRWSKPSSRSRKGGSLVNGGHAVRHLGQALARLSHGSQAGNTALHTLFLLPSRRLHLLAATRAEGRLGGALALEAGRLVSVLCASLVRVSPES
jgi:hypothetical protein